MKVIPQRILVSDPTPEGVLILHGQVRFPIYEGYVSIRTQYDVVYFPVEDSDFLRECGIECTDLEASHV